jgi:small GTP-binding protein
MIQKKICMLGSFAVGKTSLVRRFISSLFDERYHTTVGVKVDKKDVVVDDDEVRLMLWDLHGEDEFQKLRISYLRGTSGYFIVADGTRPMTLDRAYSIQILAQQEIGEVPFTLLLNKADLEADWALDEAALAEARENGWQILRTSAKTGQGVEEAFHGLARAMLGKQ